jgi:PAS domain S-box-containing protein
LTEALDLPEVEGEESPAPSSDAVPSGPGGMGPDQGREHFVYYGVVFLLLVGGSILLQDDVLWATSWVTHTVMESIATLLAFIVGVLALVRYYSRREATFLLIGCGFLGAGLLDLNHTLLTLPAIVDARVLADTRVEPASLFAWTWTAERVFLSLFLSLSLLAWRQEVRDGQSIPENWVYLNALIMALSSLLFFEWVPLRSLTTPTNFMSRPAELVPALFFGVAYVGFLGKGLWRRDPFEHWLLVSLQISVMTHLGYMMFSEQRFDAMFDAAHLFKIASYAAILAGLLHSVYATFRREGAVLGALQTTNDALAREVDVRTQAQQAYQESSDRLQRFLDNANDLVQTVNLEGRFLYVNSAWKEVLGYTDEDLDRLSLFEVIHPLHREPLEHEILRVLDGEPPRRYSVEYLASDGRVVIVSGSSQAQMVDGQAVATQSILRDVTEQRLAERRLDESQRNLEALVENTGDSIWSVDPMHRLITLNSAFALAMEARTGREPAVGDLPADVFPPEDVNWYSALYARALAGERHVAVRSDVIEGSIQYLELYANPIQASGGASGAVIFGKDVTPRVRAEEALRVAKDEAETANKAKSDFLANMSHELRTPLNSVIGFTNILLKNKDGRLEPKEIGFLERVLSNGKHLLALINEVLDLAKVEAGRMELVIEPVDLAHLCIETVHQLEGQAKTKDGTVQLLVDTPQSVAEVETDSAKLKQVIINLVGNALKFTDSGSVTVRLEVGEDRRTPVSISVTDTGIGIPADRLGAIFEAFQQAEAGTSRKYGGTGLGLALSRSICLLLGYDLIVESEEGKGSTFKIVIGERQHRLPAPEEAEAPREEASLAEPVAANMPRPGAAAGDLSSNGNAAFEPEPEPAQSVWSGFKVLIVDDEEDSRHLIEHVVEELGCRYVSTADPQEALQLAQDVRPDLITLDLMMPEISGWEVLRRLKEDDRLRPIPVVVVSMVADEDRGRLLGAVDLVTKPLERDDLLRVMWRQLGRRRGGRVLLMVADPTLRQGLADVVRAHGMVPMDPAASKFTSALQVSAPDAVVMDTTRGGGTSLGELEQLRGDRAYTGLPVLVITSPELPIQSLKRVGQLATLYAQAEDAEYELRRLLDHSFPLPDTSDVTA